MAKKTVLTDDGLKKLESELEYLKTTARQKIAEKIKTARGFGDLSENSEYDEAKNEQAKIEARIVELDALLKNVEVIDDAGLATEHVMVGSVVRILDEEYNEELEYKIVGSAEANPDQGSISDESPVGKVLLGHGVGETVIAETPSGHLSFKILDIIK